MIECIPNFSEGRRVEVVDAIERAVRSVAGVALLDRTSDIDHNRSVFTFAGSPELVAEAAFRAVAVAVECIDLTAHQGVHPRLGAADVVPFVPLESSTMRECVVLAHRFGERLWRELRLPVFFYEAAARRPEFTNLERVRQGGFEGLAGRHFDLGDAPHPTAGATVVGARKPLIAYNINLATGDVSLARRIAKKVRASSGGLPCVKALGLLLTSRNQAQVSMNLTDYEITPIHRAFEAVAAEAAREGVEIASSELIGLIPRQALEMAAAYFLRIGNFRPDMLLEQRLEATLGRQRLE